jgi:hypothetical protein
MSLTNGHVWAGYSDPETRVPAYPLKVGSSRAGETGTAVWDSAGAWMATFRNSEDAQMYIENGVRRAAQIKKCQPKFLKGKA